jgi:hypothetical protein
MNLIWNWANFKKFVKMIATKDFEIQIINLKTKLKVP